MWHWGVCVADGDSASTAKARRKLAAAMCKRLQDLLTCLRVLVGTIIAMPAVIDQQVCIRGMMAGRRIYNAGYHIPNLRAIYLRRHPTHR